MRRSPGRAASGKPRSPLEKKKRLARTVDDGLTIYVVALVCSSIGDTARHVRSGSGGGFDFWVRGQNDHRGEGELSI